MRLAIGRATGRSTGLAVEVIDGLDLAESLTMIARSLSGNMVRFVRSDNTAVTVVVTGCFVVGGQVEVLVEMIVADDAEATAVDTTESWNDVHAVVVLADGPVTARCRSVAAKQAVPAMLAATPATAVFADPARGPLVARVAGFSTELGDDITIFFGLDDRHGPEHAGRYAAVRWSELDRLEPGDRAERPS